MQTNKAEQEAPATKCKAYAWHMWPELLNVRLTMRAVLLSSSYIFKI